MKTKARKAKKVLHIRCRSKSKQTPDGRGIGENRRSSFKSSVLARSQVSPIIQPSAHSLRHHRSSIEMINNRKHGALPNDSPSINSELMSSKIQMNLRTDQRGLVDDHHRQKTKKNGCRNALIAIILAMIVIIIIVLVVTLSVLLTKSTTKSRSRAPAVLQWNATGIIVAGLGSGGGVGNELINPLGFAFDESNRMYIVEHGGHRVTRWNQQAPNGTIVAGLPNGTAATAANAFYYPCDIIVRSNGDMYITDRSNHRLQLWPIGSPSATTVAGVGSNSSVSLSGPLGLTEDSDTNTIYIASTFSHSIVAYPSGTVVAGGNGQGNASNQLNGPEGVVYDAVSKSLLITNRQGHSVSRWTLGSNSGTFVTGTSGVPGYSAATLNSPLGITIDPMGNIYVVDIGNGRVQLYENGESQGRTIAGTGLNGTALIGPTYVLLDNQLNLFVSAFSNNRTYKFFRY